MSDVIAVDLGGTNIRAARVDETGKILARDKISTLAKDGGMQAVAERIAKLVNKLRDKKTRAVGIGTPGVPDIKTGNMRLPAVNIPGSAGFPLTSEITRLTGLPVSADNDGNLAALGESWLGAGMGEAVCLIFTLGTGVGGGCVVNGSVYHGHHNMVTEFGHVSIDYQGRKCGCGGVGCLELYCSASALGRDAREAMKTSPQAETSAIFKMCGGRDGIDKVDARMVCDAARENDELASMLLDRCCLWLGTGIGSMINVFNPSCVIIGGGLSLAGDMLISRLNRVLKSGRAFAPIFEDCTLRLAKLGDDAGLLGAARIALKKRGGTKITTVQKRTTAIRKK